MIQLGDNEKELDLDSVMSFLVGKKLSDDEIQAKYKLDESELEELLMHLAGNAERCGRCGKWSYTYNIDIFNHCDECNQMEDIGIFLSNQYK